jgi:hypothetical protein
MQAFALDLCELPPSAAALREAVRAFLGETLSEYPPAGRARSWVGFDPEFSRKLGAQGWLGMTWPEPYGRARSALERYVVIEELLAAGAPVAAHWIAERQSGPLILRFGTEEQQQLILPQIAAGECFFCIGMSEPNSGSDLASIRTRAARGDGGWVINGQKVWTTYAHMSHYMIALVRTGEAGDDRHAGLSQFIVDLKTPGITVRPIRNMIGDEEFNEVIFEDAFVPDAMLVGEEGNGWQQVIAELAFERSGPDRFLSCFQLLVEMVRRAPRNPPRATKRSRYGRHRPAGCPSDHSAADVAGGRRAARRWGPASGRGDGGEGSWGCLRTVDSGDRPRSVRRIAAPRRRRRFRKSARLCAAGQRVVFAARRHGRSGDVRPFARRRGRRMAG